MLIIIDKRIFTWIKIDKNKIEYRRIENTNNQWTIMKNNSQRFSMKKLKIKNKNMPLNTSCCC